MRALGERERGRDPERDASIVDSPVRCRRIPSRCDDGPVRLLAGQAGESNEFSVRMPASGIEWKQRFRSFPHGRHPPSYGFHFGSADDLRLGGRLLHSQNTLDDFRAGVVRTSGAIRSGFLVERAGSRPTTGATHDPPRTTRHSKAAPSPSRRRALLINSQLPQSEPIGQASGTVGRIDPKTAIRELVANALIDQDFTVGGAGPMVEIFTDRIEITNPASP